MNREQQEKRLKKIVQKLKSVVLKDLNSQERERIKGEINLLDTKYTKSLIEFDQYKINMLVLLGKIKGFNWLEQFIYRETETFFTEAEKFEILTTIREV